MSLLPFIEELLNVVQRIDIDEYGLIPFMPESDSEEEFAMYPDDYCMCVTIKTLSEPVFTRLQYRSQQTLINLAEEHKLKLMELVNLLSQYMEVQKNLTEDDFTASWTSKTSFCDWDGCVGLATQITEQEYIDNCNNLMGQYEVENECIRDYKLNVYIQTMLSMYQYDNYINDYNDNLDKTNEDITRYKYQMKRMVDYLRKIKRIIQK